MIKNQGLPDFLADELVLGARTMDLWELTELPITV